MKKVICFTDSLGSGGAQRQLVGLAIMLKKRGYNVSVLVYHDIPFYKQQLDDAGIDVSVLSSYNFAHRIYRIYKYFKKHAGAIIIAYQETPSLISCLLRPFINCRKLVVSERNTTQHISIKDKIRFILWRFADIIVPNSQSQYKFIVRHFPNIKYKVHTITNFVDIDLFTHSSNVTKNKSKRILVVASAKYEKNFNGTLEAVSILKKRKFDFKVDWIGINSSELEEHQKAIRAADLKDVMQVHEPSLDVHTEYLKSDFFCLPSFFEGFPNVLCEAMSCGLPVACSSVCDHPNIVQNGINGFLFNPHDSEDMANALEKLITLSSNEIMAMSKANRTYAENALSPKTFVQQYIDIIES